MLTVKEYKERFISLLRKEIKWHRTEGEGKSGKGEEYEQGFIDGLRYAKDLVTKKFLILE